MYITDFESTAPDYIMNSDYSPHSIQTIFRDAIPAHMITPDRSSGRVLFSGVIYNTQSDDDEPMFVPINALHTRMLKSSNGIGLSEKEKLHFTRQDKRFKEGNRCHVGE